MGLSGKEIASRATKSKTRISWVVAMHRNSDPVKTPLVKIGRVLLIQQNFDFSDVPNQPRRICMEL